MITRALVAAACLLWVTASLGAQDLSGTWRARSQGGAAMTLTIHQDSAGITTGTLTRADGAWIVRAVFEGGHLRGTAERDGVVERIDAWLLGTSLLWRVEGVGGAEGEEYAFQRVAEPGRSADSVAADPFAGTWLGEGVRLVLEGTDGTYSGTLTVAGDSWSVVARAQGPVLVCTIAARGETGRLTATLSGDGLMLSGRAASAPLKRAAPSGVNR